MPSMPCFRYADRHCLTAETLTRSQVAMSSAVLPASVCRIAFARELSPRWPHPANSSSSDFSSGVAVISVGRLMIVSVSLMAVM
jgi:hypothetical protein